MNASVMAFPMARKALETIIMAEREGHADMEFIKWSTLNQEAGKVMFTAYRKAHFNLLRLRKKKVQLLQYLATGGRKAREPSRNERFHKRIMEDYFGIPRFEKDGVVHAAIPAFFTIPKFYRRFRISPYTFEKLYNGIVDPVTGSSEFRKGPDATGTMGASALQKLVSCIRQLAYGNSADVAEEYTGVQEKQGRLMLYAFCRWLDVVHEPTYLGVWIAKAVKKEMDKNAKSVGIGCIFA